MEIDYDELIKMAVTTANSVRADANSLNREPKIYLHWSGCRYGFYSPHYHLNIDENGGLHLMNSFDKTTDHTWRRNTGSIGICFAGCEGAGSNGLGDSPITAEAIEAMAKCIAMICDSWGVPIDKNHVLTHGEAANCEDGEYPHQPYAWWNDSYGDGDTRGDLEYLGTEESPSYNPYATDGSRGGDVLRGKAIFYQQEGANG